MSNGNNNYYVGPPAEKYTAPATKQQAPQVTGAAQQPPASAATHNYFVGHPVNPEMTQQPAELAASLTTLHPPRPKNRSSFLSRCFPCICGNGAPEQ